MLSACFLALHMSVASTDEIVLREGLAISDVGERGPYSTFVDHAIAKLQANGWKAPKPGDVVPGLDGKNQAWKVIKAGPDNVLPREEYRRGWTYFEVESKKPRIMLLEASGCGETYVDGHPRAADLHAYGWVNLPVKLKAGKTTFMFTSGRGPFKGKLVSPPGALFLNLGDPTLPDVQVGKGGKMWAGIITTNATESFQRNLKIIARMGDGKAVETALGPIPPLTLRKFPVAFEAPSRKDPGEMPLTLTLTANGRQVDTQSISVRFRGPFQTRKVTFISRIDGSLQYFAVNPAQTPGDGKPLVMGLHGARTEGLEMADDYGGKDWCHIVCATNRRPFGFDWEDIGRLDMLEVLEHAKVELKTDPERTYLTGHSMGGHGTWINGFMFPDHWAAIAPCSAWICASTYWGRIEPTNPAEEAMFRASNASETLLMKSNSLNYPIYIHHGDKDEDVDYAESVRMKSELDQIAHPKVTFHTMVGAGHWYGSESIDWPGIFDLFRGLRLTPNRQKDAVDFCTVNLSASASAWWLEILQQDQQMAISRARFHREPGRLVGTTENIAAIKFLADAFPTGPGTMVIDGQEISGLNIQNGLTLQKVGDKWTVIDRLPKDQKNPGQMGPFKAVFNNRFRFVYGTKGSRSETAENLSFARFQAEDFLVRGNGSVEIVSDRDLLKEMGRGQEGHPSNLMLFGNEDSNFVWKPLLSRCPIKVGRGMIKVGGHAYRGTDLACMFIWPREGIEHALVGVAASTGKMGFGTLERLQFFMPDAHYPDWTIVGSEMYDKGIKSIRSAGFFDNRWNLPGER